MLQFVGDKAKGRIAKWVFQENKARQSEHFLPPDRHTYVYVSGGKKCSFFGKFGVLCFRETLVLRFALLRYYRRIYGSECSKLSVKIIEIILKPLNSSENKLIKTLIKLSKLMRYVWLFF